MAFLPTSPTLPSPTSLLSSLSSSSSPFCHLLNRSQYSTSINNAQASCRSIMRAIISKPDTPTETEKMVGGGVTPTADKFEEQYDGIDVESFIKLATSKSDIRMIPMWHKVFSDHLTPVTAYRCLVSDEDLTTPSFLLESVPTPGQVGRYSLVGTRPIRQVVAYEHDVTITDYVKDSDESKERKFKSDDPWKVISEMSDEFKPVEAPKELPGGADVFNGGWVGYGGYDTMRYSELKSLPFKNAPVDDRQLPDLHMGLYLDVVLFDHLKKLIYVIHWVDLPQSNLSTEQLRKVHENASKHLNNNVDIIINGKTLTPLPAGRVSINVNAAAGAPCKSNMTKSEFMTSLSKIHEYLCCGDTFQTVFSQRFERKSKSNPFNVYRSLRIINPSPYMIYMQCKDNILVASSPEILTRVVDRILTNRPLAGTRRRGTTTQEDDLLAQDLLNDGKDKSEHMMLVDLGRNDIGKVVEYGSIKCENVMKVEKYSHVMHLSSNVSGKLRSNLTSWDALRATLPAGTISGAPKIRSMQIIDELEPTKRGPYGGGIGYVSFYDTMNIALALRTMVVPTKPDSDKKWTYYLQAGAGIVFESDPESEYRETVNKSMALSRAIDLAENAF